MADAEDADPRGGAIRDFALWKGRKADEPETASWPTYGSGRPGVAPRVLGDGAQVPR